MENQTTTTPLSAEQIAEQTGGRVLDNKAQPQQDNFDEGYERPPSNYIKWGKIGDVIKGTYIGNFKQRGKNGQEQTVYEIEVEAGQYHNIKEIPEGSRNYVVDEKPTVLIKGEIYNVGGKKIIDNVMRRARIGQKVLMRYINDFPTPAGIAKTVETKLGPINEDFLNSNSDDIKVEQIPFD